MIFSVEEVLKATGGKLLQGEKNLSFRGISTDTRNLAEGDLFIALEGPRFDGHHFALQALEKNAGGVLVQERKAADIRWNGYRPKAVIAVKDTLYALGDLARARRRGSRIPVVALTGSNGKTTTKEMIAACFEIKFPVLRTKGNLNNLIGLPLTLLSLTDRERVAVVEMGMNVPGEIGRLTEIAEPDVGLITNIQRAHLEGLGSLERIKEEKADLFRKMKRDGTILVNQNDPHVIDLAQEFPGQKITFGVEKSSDVMAKDVRIDGTEGTSFTLVMENEEHRIRLPLLGKHFVPNGLAAISAASLFGIEAGRIKEALEHFKPSPMRMEVVHLGKKTLINDAYNANPRSMELALETLVEVKGPGRAIAVLGDMLELGAFSEEAHQQLGEKAAELGIDYLLALGSQAPLVVQSAIRHGMKPENTSVAESHSEAVSVLKRLAREGDWILLKGSRRMAMEKIMDGLERRG